MSDTERLEKAFDSLDADIDTLLARYRALKASHAELLDACNFAVVALAFPRAFDLLQIRRNIRDVITKAEAL